MSQPKGARLPQARLHSPHATKTLQSKLMFPDRLLDIAPASARLLKRSMAPEAAVVPGLPHRPTCFACASTRPPPPRIARKPATCAHADADFDGLPRISMSTRRRAPLGLSRRWNYHALFVIIEILHRFFPLALIRCSRETFRNNQALTFRTLLASDRIAFATRPRASMACIHNERCRRNCETNRLPHRGHRRAGSAPTADSRHFLAHSPVPCSTFQKEARAPFETSLRASLRRAGARSSRDARWR
jgi:hypothetical protein